MLRLRFICTGIFLVSCLSPLFSQDIPIIIAPSQEIPFEEAKALFGGQKILTFRKFSLSLDDKSQQSLAQLAAQINQSPGIIRNNLLIIQTFTCPEELTAKPYIGAVRGQVIIDYLEKKIGLNRKKCFIQESGSTQDPNCLAGSGANIYLQDGWLEQ